MRLDNSLDASDKGLVCGPAWFGPGGGASLCGGRRALVERARVVLLAVGFFLGGIRKLVTT